MIIAFDEQRSTLHKCFCHCKISLWKIVRFRYSFIPVCKVICCLEILKSTQEVIMNKKFYHRGFNSSRIQQKVKWGLWWIASLFYKVKLSFLLSCKTHWALNTSYLQGKCTLTNTLLIVSPYLQTWYLQIIKQALLWNGNFMLLSINVSGVNKADAEWHFKVVIFKAKQC